MPPTLFESLQDACMLDALTLTGGLQDVLTLTGGLQDAPTLTGGLQDAPTLTGGLQDAPTLTGGLQDAPTLTGGLQDAPTSTGGRSATSLTDEIKAFIVRGLARYETPSEVAQAVNETFGIEVSRQLVYKYDPAGCKPPAERWISLHAMTRAKFLADLAEIGVAQKVVRLRMLDRFVQDAEENHAFTKAAAFLEQAAKECGGIYEGRKPPSRRPPDDDAALGAG